MSTRHVIYMSTVTVLSASRRNSESGVERLQVTENEAECGNNSSVYAVALAHVQACSETTLWTRITG